VSWPTFERLVLRHRARRNRDIQRYMTGPPNTGLCHVSEAPLEDRGGFRLQENRLRHCTNHVSRHRKRQVALHLDHGCQQPRKTAPVAHQDEAVESHQIHASNAPKASLSNRKAPIQRQGFGPRIISMPCCLSSTSDFPTD
jgi:hypothetical protein